MATGFDAIRWANDYRLRTGQLTEYVRRYKELRQLYDNGEKINMEEAEFLEEILSRHNFLSARYDYNRRFTK